MIVRTRKLKIVRKKTDNPLEDLLELKRKKEILFSACIGSQEEERFLSFVRDIEDFLQIQGAPHLCVAKGFEKNFQPAVIEEMKEVWKKYERMERNGAPSATLHQFSMAYSIEDAQLEWTKKSCFLDLLRLYDANEQNTNASIRRNFGVKILLWMDLYLERIFSDIQRSKANPKIVFYGPITKHEFYFLYFLFQLGCDTCYLASKEASMNSIGKLKRYMDFSVLEKFPAIPEKTVIDSRINRKDEKNIYGEAKQNIREDEVRSIPRTEKTYEQLATMSESVVMINVYDFEKQIIGRGSGVVINTQGFIITNCHVLVEGTVFEILFENESYSYFCDQVIKYHTEYDLALLKIERKTKPVPVGSGAPLARGQKIVAIGSPLGLFNTISDGIVSGFRSFKQCEMIQITAPISPGSSGGALLDLYGELAGITTAGLDGQNLNLAVPVQYVKRFAHNFIGK